jgi:hypothetical protein
LGEAGPHLRPGQGHASLFTDQAGRVVHCTRDLAAERAEIKRLRAAGDALAEVADEWPELVEAWQEARRER